MTDVPDLVTPIGVDQLLDAGALADGTGRCWVRSTASLRNVRERLQGLAIASEARIEAYLIHEEAEREGARHVVACGAADPGRAEPLLGLLSGIYAGRAASPVRLAQVAPDEISFSLLERLGFRPGDRTLRYATEAEPG